MTLGLFAGREGNMTFLRAVRELAGKVGLAADEIKKFEIKEEDGQTKWSPKYGETAFEISFSGGEHSMITEALQKLEKEERLTENHFSLYEKFVEK